MRTTTFCGMVTLPDGRRLTCWHAHASERAATECAGRALRTGNLAEYREAAPGYRRRGDGKMLFLAAFFPLWLVSGRRSMPRGQFWVLAVVAAAVALAVVYH